MSIGKVNNPYSDYNSEKINSNRNNIQENTCEDTLEYMWTSNDNTEYIVDCNNNFFDSQNDFAPFTPAGKPLIEYDTRFHGNFNINEVVKNSNFAGSVIEGYSDFISETCEQYGVDPYLILSIIAFETGWGTADALLYYNNPGGLMDFNDDCEFIYFDTLKEGIEAVISTIRDYANNGLTTIEEIGSVYSPVGEDGSYVENDIYETNDNWIPSIQDIYSNLSGKEVDITTELFY